MSEQRTRIGVLLLAAGAVLIGLGFGVCTQDDAFISFRYAENLVAGHGLVYNPDERVEGYTNLSWTLLMAGAMATGFDLVAASILLGLLAWVSAIPVAMKLAPRAGGFALIAPALFVLDPLFLLETVQGLESSLFMLLCAAGVWQALVEREAARSHVGSSLFFSLACLTRPEGALIAVLTHVGLLLTASGRRGQLRASVLAGVPVLLTLLVSDAEPRGQAQVDTLAAAAGADVWCRWVWVSQLLSADAASCGCAPARDASGDRGSPGSESLFRRTPDEAVAVTPTAAA